SFLAALPDRRPRSQYKRAALRATRKATRHLSRMTRLTRFLRMDNVRGSVLMVASMAGFAVEDVLIKQMTSALPIGQVLALIGCGGTLVFGTFTRIDGKRVISRD